MFALFEDRQAGAGEPAAWLFEHPLGCLSITDPASLATALAEVGRGQDWWVLALDYELGYLLEAAAAPPGWRPDPARPLARFWRFGACRQLSQEAVESWLGENLSGLAGDAAKAGIGGLYPGVDENAYCQAVARIRDYIAAGDCYQVNYTFPLHFDWFGHPLALYDALRRRQPVRYGGLVADAEGGVVSLSPELFLERQGRRLTTRPMKGTAPRSADPEALRASEKDRAENLMIVDLLRNDLGRIAASGTVRVDSLFEIEAYPSLWQMVSQVSAELPVSPVLSSGDHARQSSGKPHGYWIYEACPGTEAADLGKILEALFPCGSITGAPKIRAMQIISELEATPRRLYTGALGWLAPGGNFRLNVAIRTLELDPGGQGRLGIGSGIVADSKAEAEWQECLLKSAFLTDLDPGLQLIETLRLEAGTYTRLEGHLARLQASAAWLGFPFDAAAFHQVLAEPPREGIWRVRLSLAKSGEIGFAQAPLPPEPAGPRFARLARERSDSRNPLRRHKTTARSLYDTALKDIAATPEIFDVVFLNERGEVAEGARSTVFVERNGLLLTPPLESGVLPGVLRAELLASGQAREAVLGLADLAGDFFLGNALRGLIPVRLRAD